MHLVLKIVHLASIRNSAKLARIIFFSSLLLIAVFHHVPLSIIQVLENAIVAKLLASNAFHRLNVFPVKDYFSLIPLAFQCVQAQHMEILL